MTNEEVLNYSYPISVDVNGNLYETSKEEILENFEFYKALAELEKGLNDDREKIDEFFKNQIEMSNKLSDL